MSHNGNIVEQIHVYSLFLEMFSGINNLGFLASNLNCSNAKDYEKTLLIQN